MKKNILILLLLSSTSLMLAQQKLKVGNNPATLNPSAALEVESITKGFLPPRMTKSQRNGISVSTTTKGLTVYCTDCAPEGLYTYNGTDWTAVGSLSGASLADGKILIGNSANAATAITPSGDVTIDNTGVTAIGDAKVTNAMLQGSIDLTAKVTGVLPVANGGTGTASITGFLKGNGTGAFTSVSSIPVADVAGAVKSVNGITPTDGNVAVAIGNVTTGTLASKPLSGTNNGDIYVVSGDSTSDNNGRTYIWDSSNWQEITSNLATTDLRYVKVSGSTMGGDLSFPAGKKITIVDAPTGATDVANKKYVDDQDLVKAPIASPVFTGTATAPTFSSIASTGTAPFIVASTTPVANLSIGGNAATATNATTTTNIAGGTLGAVPYQTAAGTTSFLAGNTTSTAKFLTSTGDGTTAAAPTWTSFNAIPYTGATGAVNLGSYDLKVNGITVGKGGDGTQDITAIGFNSLKNNTSGVFNTAIGNNSLSSNISGRGNTAIGDSALKANTIGNYNTAIGDTALVNNDEGNSNTVVGESAMINNLSGSNNIAIGDSALYNIENSINNSAIGTGSLFNLKDGNSNIALGYDAGNYVTEGSNNIFIGNQTDYLKSMGMTSGNYNTIIGSDITGLSERLNNNIILADGQGNIRAQHDGAAWDLKTTVKGVTETATDNSTNLATTAFVSNAIATATPDANTSTKGILQLAGDLSGTADSPTVTNTAKINGVLTGFTSASGTVSATDTVLGAIQKVDGNVALKAPIASPVFTGITATAPTFTSTASTGTAPFIVTSTTPVANLTATNATNTTITDDTTTAGQVYPTFVTANTGNLPQKVTSGKLSFVPSTGILTATKFSGDGSGLSGIIAATNANLTGPITSVGNATAVNSQTGTGSKFVMDTSPTLVTPTIGIATATSINKVTITVPTTSATLTIANGKTLTANNSISLSGTDNTTMTFPSTTATIARTDAAQTFTGIQSFSSPIAGSITGNAATATSIAAGALGSIPYQSAAGATTFLAGNTTSTPKFLTSTGTGTIANAPTWADVSTVAVPYTGATAAVDLGAYDLKVNGISVGVGKGNLSSNIAMGELALSSNSIGINNNALGKNALKANTEGNANVALGNGALISNTDGNENIAIGLSALGDTSTGSDSNIAMGYYAFKNLLNSDKNIGIGNRVGYGFTTGVSNIFIGNGTSTNNGLISGDNNTIIGSNFTGLPTTLSNNIILADGQGNIRAQYNNGWTFGNVTLPTSATTATLATTADINFPAISSVVKTTAYTALTTDYTILCDASTSGFTLTIPAAATTNTGKMYVINKIDDSTNALSFSPALKLSSATTVSSVNFNQTLRIQSDGTNWWIIN